METESNTVPLDYDAWKEGDLVVVIRSMKNMGFRNWRIAEMTAIKDRNSGYLVWRDGPFHGDFDKFSDADSYAHEIAAQIGAKIPTLDTGLMIRRADRTQRVLIAQWSDCTPVRCRRNRVLKALRECL